jgi:hypothetical protein
LAIDGIFHERAILVLFSVLVIYIVSEKVQGFFSARAEDQSRAEIKTMRDQTLELMSKRLEVVCIGSHTDAFEYCMTRRKHLKRLQDTYFRTEPDNTLISFPLVKGLYHENLELLLRGGSIDVLVSNNNISAFNEVVDDIRNEIINSQKRLKFYPRILDQKKIPLINIQIMTYTDDSREVLFGWNFRNADDGLVFSSKEERIVRYYSSLYEETRIGCSTWNLMQNPDTIGSALTAADSNSPSK